MSSQRCEVSQLVRWYREFLNHGKSAAFVSCVATRYDNTTLCRLTTLADAESRRASVLALGMLGGEQAIAPIGRSLSDADRCVRLVAEMSFTDVCRRAEGEAFGRQLDIARRHIDGKRYESAQQLLKQLTKVCPYSAEAWYQRAVVRYCKQDFVPAIGYARRAVNFNEFHYASHTLEGRIWLELETPSRALTSFRRSFAINPSQLVVQNHIEQLTRRMRSGKQ